MSSPLGTMNPFPLGNPTSPYRKRSILEHALLDHLFLLPDVTQRGLQGGPPSDRKTHPGGPRDGEGLLLGPPLREPSLPKVDLAAGVDKEKGCEEKLAS